MPAGAPRRHICVLKREDAEEFYFLGIYYEKVFKLLKAVLLFDELSIMFKNFKTMCVR